MENENNYYKNIIDSLKEENEDIQKKMENEKNKLKKIIEKLENEIVSKDKIIEENNNKNLNLIKSMKPGEKILKILFKKEGNKDDINYEIQCKNTDLFVRLEEKLYNDYPKFKNCETFFLVNNRKVFRFKTMEENQIKNNDTIFIIC